MPSQVRKKKKKKKKKKERINPTLEINFWHQIVSMEK